MKNRLREIRKAKINPATKKPMTAKDLGDLVDLSQAQIQRLESGQRDFTLKTLGRIAAVLGVGANEITDISVKGVNKATNNPDLLDMIVGFLLEAHDRNNMKKDKTQIGRWASMIYAETAKLDFNLTQIKGVVNLVVKTSWKGTK